MLFLKNMALKVSQIKEINKKYGAGGKLKVTLDKPRYDKGFTVRTAGDSLVRAESRKSASALK